MTTNFFSSKQEQEPFIERNGIQQKKKDHFFNPNPNPNPSTKEKPN
jgi:hypothetical protein